MTTRLYVNNDVGPPVNLSPAAAWDVTSSMVRYRLEKTKETVNTGSTTPGANKSVAGPVNILIIQAFLPYLAAQTFSGNFRAHFRASVTNGLLDAVSQCVVRVINPETGTVRGTLISASSVSAVSATPDAVGYEWTSGAARSSRFPTGYTGTGEAVASVDSEENDWIVAEFGYRGLEVGSSVRTGILTVTQTPAVATPDVGANETDTTNPSNCWLEFSNDVITVPRAVPSLPWPDRVKNIRFPQLDPENPTRGQLWPRGWNG